MTAAWIVVGLVGALTVAIKAAGPVLLGARPMPARASAVVATENTPTTPSLA